MCGGGGGYIGGGGPACFPLAVAGSPPPAGFLYCAGLYWGPGTEFGVGAFLLAPFFFVSASVRSSHVLMVSIVVVMCVGMVNRNGWQMSRSFGRKGVGVLRGNSGRGF